MTPPNAHPFPPVIVGAWQLSEGHHRDAPDRASVLADLEAIVEMPSSDELVAFDCADIYTGVEQLLGDLLGRLASAGASGRRRNVRIHTKLVPDRADLGRVDRSYVSRIVERSCQRLGVDRLDLVQYAWWDYDVPGYVECGLFLEELRQEGKIASIGVTNFDVPRLREILDAGVPVIANQLQYSALDHRPQPDMVDLCVGYDVALLSYGTLAGGFLTDSWFGRPDPTLELDAHATELGTRSQTKYRLIIEEFGGWHPFQDLLATLADIGRIHGASIAQIATAYALSLPGVSSVIAGVARPDRWRATLRATRVELTPEQLERIRAHGTAAPGPAGPVFGLEREAGSRHAAVMKYDLNSGSEAFG